MSNLARYKINFGGGVQEGFWRILSMLEDFESEIRLVVTSVVNDRRNTYTRAHADMTITHASN